MNDKNSLLPNRGLDTPDRGHDAGAIDRELLYVCQLATALWDKHYRDEAPHWRPLPDLMGVLTQIDNMTTGLVRTREPDTLAVAQAIYDRQYGKGAWMNPHQMKSTTRDLFVELARAAIAAMPRSSGLARSSGDGK